MATPCYPDSVAVEEYRQGDVNAIHAQLSLVGVQFPERAREFAEQAAREVASLFCQHNCEPPILASAGCLKTRVLAAREHSGLCGVYHAGIIAGVEYNAVAMRAATVTYKGLRNQVCFDASQALNARGRGVQVARKECFTEACRALFPGEAQVEDWVEVAPMQAPLSYKQRAEDRSHTTKPLIFWRRGWALKRRGLRSDSICFPRQESETRITACAGCLPLGAVWVYDKQNNEGLVCLVTQVVMQVLAASRQFLATCVLVGTS